MNNYIQMKETNCKRNEAIDVECRREELINIKKNFLNEEEDDYIKDSKRYLYDELSYINRINTFKIWLKKPVHLCSIILARNGYICENEYTIKCEMCNCKYIYEKDKYSMYTKINDLCLLHFDNCPWKNNLMSLSIFRLDEKSLKREELIKEYEINVSMLKNALYEIPLINIKKTIKDLIIIIKKHMENNFSKKKYTIFNWYINFFKNQFTQIFLNNKSVIEKGIEKIKENYKDYEKYIVDLNYINDLNFDISDETNYVNILCDETSLLKDEKEDINMYFKIVDKMKNYEYENINIYKIISLCGWSYKGDSVDNNNNFTQVLYCKYCYREIKICNYSTFSIRDNKLLLFKELNLLETKDLMDDLISKKKKLEKVRNSNSCVGSDTINILEQLSTLLNKTKNNNKNNSYNNNNISNIRHEDNNYYNSNNNDSNGNNNNKNNNNNSYNNSNNNISNIRHEDNNHYNGNNNDSNDNNNKGNSYEETKNETEKKKLNNNIINEDDYSFKWKKKDLILTKRSNDIFKDKNNNTLFFKNNKKYFFTNRNEDLFSKKNSDNKESSLKNSISKIYIEISEYLKNEDFFIKTLYDYYVLTDSQFFYSNESGNDKKKNRSFYNIRLFDIIENHRAYCPYMTEDLYSFSKITKLFFELLISEFQRKYVFK
ncbi:zinc finger protein, putative [Plasmodium relictum]|uniref:Zinc finger protein, putative n=1 Tax=Plasmodium relictum TaxID=85471 RepID=A0A1J1H6R1_PLARL|nr:zinc finger protein, putative [Plasmodium relictum]CRH00468.1 zinc finger protein, putative [Plasmodium relictum]